MVPLLLIESEFTTVGSTDRHGSYVVVEEEIVAYPNPTPILLLVNVLDRTYQYCSGNTVAVGGTRRRIHHNVSPEGHFPESTSRYIYRGRIQWGNARGASIWSHDSLEGTK